MPAPECADELRKVYDAIMALSTGARAVTVTFTDRSVTYTQVSLKTLSGIYRAFYRDCGADSGLPDLANTTQRGGPAYIRFT